MLAEENRHTPGCHIRHAATLISLTFPNGCMEPALRDTVYAGILLWVAGYLASMAVYFSGLDYAIWGKVVLILYLPCVAVFAYRYFSGRHLRLRYFAGIGLAWSLIAIILDFPFIVLRFGAWQYYGPDVYLYYIAMVLIPAGAGWYLNRTEHRKEETAPLPVHTHKKQ